MRDGESSAGSDVFKNGDVREDRFGRQLIGLWFGAIGCGVLAGRALRLSPGQRKTETCSEYPENERPGPGHGAIVIAALLDIS